MATATVQALVTPLLVGCDLEDYDYYIYNNRFFVPVPVDLDDKVESNECLLHICTKDVPPQDDRFQRPYSVHTVANLFMKL